MTLPYQTRSNELQDCFLSASAGKIISCSKLELDRRGTEQADFFTRLREATRARKELKHNSLGRLAARL